VARHLLIFAIVVPAVTLVTLTVAVPLLQPPGGPGQEFWMQLRGRGYLTLLLYILVSAGGAAMTLQDRYRERQAAAAALQAELATARLQALRNHGSSCLHERKGDRSEHAATMPGTHGQHGLVTEFRRKTRGQIAQAGPAARRHRPALGQANTIVLDIDADSAVVHGCAR
jgi:hypothetical protein